MKDLMVSRGSATPSGTSRLIPNLKQSLSKSGSLAWKALLFLIVLCLQVPAFAQNITVSGIDELLESMGFEVSNLGNNTWAINAVPSILGKESPTAALIDIISAVAQEEDDIERSQWQKIALSMARSAAVKYGTPLKKAEMDALVGDLFRLPAPTYTPDGKTVLTTITIEEIHKLF